MYDNEDICAEYDTEGNLITNFIHGQGIDDPILMTKSNNSYYYTFDGLGSVVGMAEENQTITEFYEYDAFGNLKNLPETGNPYTYTSREYDYETELYFYRARYYNSTIGRFITADPIGFKGGINFYTYVKNRPINFIDPKGLFDTQLFRDCLRKEITISNMYADLLFRLSVNAIKCAAFCSVVPQVFVPCYKVCLEKMLGGVIDQVAQSIMDIATRAWGCYREAGGGVCLIKK